MSPPPYMQEFIRQAAEMRQCLEQESAKERAAVDQEWLNVLSRQMLESPHIALRMILDLWFDAQKHMDNIDLALSVLMGELEDAARESEQDQAAPAESEGND